MTNEIVVKKVRDVSAAELLDTKPVYVVWEITLACNLKCNHCGSRAGSKRPDELSTAEAFDLIDRLAALGTREITIIGGEAFLRKDWLELIRRITDCGMRATMQSGGFHLTKKRLAQAQEAGLAAIGVSIDGMRALHDRVRGVKGSWDHAIDAIRSARELGMTVAVNTQIGPETQPDIEPLMNELIAAGANHWRFQLTVAMGNAVDNDHLILQPYELSTLMPEIARITTMARSRGLRAEVGNNVGFFGPYEHLFRGIFDGWHWTGCGAGVNVIGIEADGTIKGCPSLATEEFGAGNIRDFTIEDIWNYSERMHFGRMRSVKDMWGFCGTCYYADVCRAGCTWTAHSLFGKAGNNPWCHHRVIELEKRGLRERVVKRAEAPNLPFAIGEFGLVTEPIPGREATAPVQLTTAPAGAGPLVQIQIGKANVIKKPENGEPIPRGHKVRKLYPCKRCDRHVFRQEKECPHCGVSAPVILPPKAVTPQAQPELVLA